jgi:hypothetical protein
MIGRPADNEWNYRVPAQHLDFGHDAQVHMLDKIFKALSVPGRIEYGLIARISSGCFYF